jgi:hypothetical protein
MPFINKNIQFRIEDKTLIEDKIIEYFKESGFKLVSIQNGKLTFSRGSILTNLFTFNPLKWKSKIGVEIIDKEVKVNANINTIGQTVIDAEDNLWNVFLTNLKFFLTKNIDYKEINSEVLRSTKKESYNFIEEITIGTSDSSSSNVDSENENSFRNKERMNWLFKLIAPTLLVSIVYSLYTGLLDIWLYDKVLSWLAAFILLFGIPATIYWSIRLWVKSDARRLLAIVFSAISIFIFAILFGFWSDRHEEEIYRKNGIKTKAVVTETFHDGDGKRMYYEFIANGIRYVSFNVSNKNGHLVGDTLEVICNKNNPKMNEALELLDN